MSSHGRIIAAPKQHCEDVLLCAEILRELALACESHGSHEDAIEALAQARLVFMALQPGQEVTVVDAQLQLLEAR